MSGTPGDDSLLGTSGNDTINGLAGNDTIDGLGGEDVLRGGSDHDQIDGGTGDDTLIGDSGNDTIDGGAGADEIRGDYRMIDFDVINGDAQITGPGEITLTEEIQNQAGSAASSQKQSFGDSFQLSFTANLGSNNGSGADGIAVAFHNDPDGVNTIGSFGGGLGASGIEHALVIEFDTFQNTNLNDPVNDHTKLYYNDGTNVGDLTSNFDLGNIEDGQDHQIVVDWNATTHTLSWTFDGVTAGSHTFPASGPGSVEDIFGTTEVFLYTSGGTGGLVNEQVVSNFMVNVGDGSADDSIDGGTGSDTIYGDGGDDIIQGGADADSLMGGDGNDTLTYKDSDAAVDVSLETGTASGGHATGDTIDGFENLHGSAHNDSLAGGGTGFSGEILGLAGNDTMVITGLDSTDDLANGGELYDGGADNDIFVYDPTRKSDDTLIGGAGDDTLQYENAPDGGFAGISVNNDGDGTNIDASGAAGGGAAYTNQVFQSIENFEGRGPDASGADLDVITITDTDIDGPADPTGTLFLASEVQGLDDNSVGTFTPANGNPVIHFGPGQANQLSDILARGVDGQIQITSGDESGTVGNISFTDFETINFGITCFVRGTLIRTPNGDVPIEDLNIGDLVETFDGSNKPIRWIGARRLDSIDLQVNPKLKPILIRADALGAGFPKVDLLVSPQHRILVRSVIAQRMFGKDEVLIPANKLVPLSGIEVVEQNPNGVEYFHMLFEQHEIVWSNGAATESLYTGREALRSLSPASRLEIQKLFPEICDPNFEAATARLIPKKGQQIKMLTYRHQKNSKPLFFAE